jgi:hypothetical protein
MKISFLNLRNQNFFYLATTRAQAFFDVFKKSAARSSTDYRPISGKGAPRYSWPFHFPPPAMSPDKNRATNQKAEKISRVKSKVSRIEAIISSLIFYPDLF